MLVWVRLLELLSDPRNAGPPVDAITRDQDSMFGQLADAITARPVTLDEAAADLAREQQGQPSLMAQPAQGAAALAALPPALRRPALLVRLQRQILQLARLQPPPQPVAAVPPPVGAALGAVAALDLAAARQASLCCAAAASDILALWALDSSACCTALGVPAPAPGAAAGAPLVTPETSAVLLTTTECRAAGQHLRLRQALGDHVRQDPQFYRVSFDFGVTLVYIIVS